MTMKTIECAAEDGTVIAIGVPAGPLPTNEEAEIYGRAFALVTPERFDATKDWKDAIDAIVTSVELREKNVSIQDVVRAVQFFTSTEATVRNVAPRGTSGVAVYHVTALGYRRGPAW